MEDSTSHLRRLYADICRGYSVSRFDGRVVYVKHFNVFDYTEVDEMREAAFRDITKRGIKTETQQREWLSLNGLWSKKDDQDIAIQEDYIASMRKTRSKAHLISQAKQMDTQIAEAEAKLSEMVNKRVRLLGKTAEQVADQKVQYEYMRLGFFADSDLKTPLLTPESIAELDGRDIDHLLFSYIDIINRFSADSLRRIAIAPFFTNHYYLCGDDPTRFFNKPVVNLTIYQTNLLSYASYFKILMTQNEIPKEMANNPDKIEDFIARSRNMKSLVNKAGEGDRVAIVGASKDDFKALGVEDSTDLVRADAARGIKSGLEAAKNRDVIFTKPR